MINRMIKVMCGVVCGMMITSSSMVTTDTVKTTGFETETYYVKSQADYERSADAITHKDGKILIQIVQGTVISDNGDGELDTGGYIKYDVDLKQGDRVETVLVYNPATNYTDDVMYRADTLIK